MQLVTIVVSPDANRARIASRSVMGVVPSRCSARRPATLGCRRRIMLGRWWYKCRRLEEAVLGVVLIIPDDLVTPDDLARVVDGRCNCSAGPLPQGIRLLCAAKRVERIGSDAGAVLGQIVVSSDCDVVCAKKRFSPVVSASRWLAPIARARLRSSRAPAKSPSLLSSTARSLRLSAVS